MLSFASSSGPGRFAWGTALLVSLLLGATGCDTLRQLATDPAPGASAPIRPTPPRVTVASVELAHAPTNAQLAAHYCGEVAPALLCNSAFGAAPSADDLRFVFDVNLDVQNPNSYPIPLVEMLAAFTAFPAVQGQQNLGAVCIAMHDDGTNAASSASDGCQSNDPELRSMSDYANAAAGFLIALAQGRQSVDNLRVRTLAAGGTTHVDVRLGLNPDAVLSLIRTVASDAIAQLREGTRPTFQIPYRVEGTAFLHVENFGRLAAGFGPFDGTWNLQS